jgi:antirestriction protein ArdC
MEVSPLVERLTESPEWSRLMQEALTMPGRLSGVYNRFYVYSFNNQILLWMQGVTEPVATFKRWQEMNRRVKKGSKAKAILRPITIKLKDDLDDQGNPKQLTKFKLVNALFMASETEGEDLPPYEPPEWCEDAAMSALGIERVSFEHLDGNTQGYSYERKVAINPVAAYPLKTLFHELGHVVIGHTDPDKIGEYKKHRGVAEFQAEAVAYLCMNDVGATEHMDAAGSRAYIQSWLSGEKPSDQAIREVFKAVDTILRAGVVVKEPVST